jgi:hypothetical protein
MKWETVRGWPAFQQALADGRGDEFIQRLSGLGPNDFSGATEREAVLKAARWVAKHTRPRRVAFPPGLACGSAKAMYDEMMTSVMLQGVAPADSLNQAILLASLLRFHTNLGLPPERVFVFVAVRGTSPRRAMLYRAWIVYKEQATNKWWYLSMAYGERAYSGNPPRELSEKPPQLPPKSTYVLFNDRFVKGKGPLWEEEKKEE